MLVSAQLPQGDLCHCVLIFTIIMFILIALQFDAMAKTQWKTVCVNYLAMLITCIKMCCFFRYCELCHHKFQFASGMCVCVDKEAAK